MLNRLIPTAATIAVLLLAACGQPEETQPAPGAAQTQPADLVLRGGAIHTMDASRTVAEAIAVRDGRIVHVGATAEADAFVGPGTEVVELEGMMVLPGFHDAHTHPLYGGLVHMQCNLTGLPSVDAVLAKVRQCTQLAGPDDWVVGGGWELSLFPDGNAPKALLDDAAGERPVHLMGADGHSAWVSSRALQIAGIDADTPNPELGIIERDPETGEATGTLREAAIALVGAHLPEPTTEDWLAAGRFALALHNRYGITSLIDAAVGERDVATYAALAKRGELTARIDACLEYGTSLIADNGDFETVFSRVAAMNGPRLSTRTVKIFVDGVLEGETAALIEPYLGERGHSGTLNHEPAGLRQAVVDFDARDIQVHMHAIGDRAVREALDAVQAARQANGARDNRHHIAHLQLIADEDIPRFAELGVFANFQALWAYPDAYITDINLPVVGEARVQRMYRIGSVARADGTIVGGSDWNVSSVNPLDAIQTAITRADITGSVDGVLNPDERVDLPLMLAAYTINGARLMGHEDETGSIETGKAADLVILEHDLFEIPVERIATTRVLRTILDGETVFDADAEGPASAQGTP